jgi:hypothetical protein
MDGVTTAGVHAAVPDVVLANGRSVVGCSCGWRSVPVVTVEGAQRRRTAHELGAAAAGATARATAAYAAAVRNVADSARVRDHAIAQRRDIQRRRASLQAQRVQRMTAPRRAPSAAAADVDYLECARSMSGLDAGSLWVEYLAIGGNRSLDDLTAMLAGRAPMPAADFDVLAIVLNEVFDDAGSGRPIDYLCTELGRGHGGQS